MAQGNTSLAVTNTSARVKLADIADKRDLGENVPPRRTSTMLELMAQVGTIAADDRVYVKTGTDSVTASATNFDTVIKPYVKELLTLRPGDTHIAMVSSANGCTVDIAVL